MASWTPPTDQQLAVGQPGLSSHIRAIRDLAQALAEAAAGAPKISLAALQPPTAGDAFILKRIQEEETELPNITESYAYLPPGRHIYYDSERHLGAICLLSGTIRVKAEQYGTSGMRILKNGTQMIQWVINQDSWVQRTYDLPVNIGDKIILQHKRNAGSFRARWRNLMVTSGTESVAVA